jgi:site-specific recombinase XerD
MDVIKTKDLAVLKSRLSLFPWYVEKFFSNKIPDLSPSSLLGYSFDYESFFSFLIVEGLTMSKDIKNIPLLDLEKLNIDDITTYRNILMDKNSKHTRDRKIAALKSLFHFLSQIAEDENQYPLLKRNVLSKVKITRSNNKTEVPKTKLFLEDEISYFIEFIDIGYLATIVDNKQAIHYYELNKIRDSAIICLILHSGLRVSEVVNLNLEDLFMSEKEKVVYVLGKGSKDEKDKTKVAFDQQARVFLERYLEIRELRYKPQRNEKALFLSNRMGDKTGKRMLKRAIQDMVVKYALAFGKKTTVHKLRHSFATAFNKKYDIYSTKKQLRHASIDTTERYAMVSSEELAHKVNNLFE